VEELLGEIDDEHDGQEDEKEHPQDDGSWRVPARREVRVLNDLHGWNLPESDHYDTLGGLILHTVGDIPEEGTKVELEEVEFVVREVEENRIMWVEFWPERNG
jgi:CBS domain containing-hemolysin-like protein